MDGFDPKAIVDQVMYGDSTCSCDWCAAENRAEGRCGGVNKWGMYVTLPDDDARVESDPPATAPLQRGHGMGSTFR